MGELAGGDWLLEVIVVVGVAVCAVSVHVGSVIDCWWWRPDLGVVECLLSVLFAFKSAWWVHLLYLLIYIDLLCQYNFVPRNYRTDLIIDR